MSSGHCSWAVLAALLTAAAAAPSAGQQQAPVFQPGATSSFMIFLRGTPIGIEQVAVSRTTEGWTLLSTGRLAQPFDVVARKVEVRYNADWKPIAFNLDTTVRGEFQRVITTIDGTTATSDITKGTQTNRKTDPVDPSSLLLPNVMYSPYEAVSALLRTTPDGATLPAYQIPFAAIRLR